ncbi:MAG: NAD(P)H-binding protein [Pseudomonadota bacterium]
MRVRILLAGATGTIGRAVARELVTLGHDVICPLRPGSSIELNKPVALTCLLSEPGSLSRALAGRRIDAVISCMATRTGAVRDAWAVEHDAQINLLNEAADAGAKHFILLSAICVQKPRLAFQKAKAAFEDRLMQSGLYWTIVRPTAFFKSLSGQVARVQAGKPYLVFGDGRSTVCKPISDRDLAVFIVRCLSDPAARNQLLPIGGPGPAITPLDQAHRLFEILEQEPRMRHLPHAFMDALVGTFGLLGRFSATMRDKAEYARTGRYYATESMLVWNADTGCYDPDATPEFGSDTLWDHYSDLVHGRVGTDLGAHAFY